MVTKKVKKIIRKKLYEYPIYERIINELELEKATAIREKNSNSRLSANPMYAPAQTNIRQSPYPILSDVSNAYKNNTAPTAIPPIIDHMD